MDDEVDVEAAEAEAAAAAAAVDAAKFSRTDVAEVSIIISIEN